MLNCVKLIGECFKTSNIIICLDFFSSEFFNIVS